MLNADSTIPPPDNDNTEPVRVPLGVIACGMALRASEDALAQLVMTLVVCPMSESDRVEVAEAYLAVERLMKSMARTLDLQRVILNGD